MLKFRLKIVFFPVQVLLLLAMILSLVWAVISLSFFKEDYSSRLSSKKLSYKTVSKSSGRLSGAGFDSLLKKVEARKVFVERLIPKKTSVGNRQKISQLIERLVMVGYLSDDTPKAIVQDKKGDTTFYLKEGDTFLDGVSVSKVSKNSLTIEYYGETFDLYL